MEIQDTSIQQAVQPREQDSIDRFHVRNVLLEASCLLIVAEIVSLLAGGALSTTVTMITGAGVLFLIIVSFFAEKAPYVTLMLALIAFIVCSISIGLIKPSFLGGSIIIKFFILIYLLRAIPEAKKLQRAA